MSQHSSCLSSCDQKWKIASQLQCPHLLSIPHGGAQAVRSRAKNILILFVLFFSLWANATSQRTVWFIGAAETLSEVWHLSLGCVWWIWWTGNVWMLLCITRGFRVNFCPGWCLMSPWDSPESWCFVFPCCPRGLMRVLSGFLAALCSCCLDVAFQGFQLLTLLMISHVPCVGICCYLKHVVDTFFGLDRLVCHCWLRCCKSSQLWPLFLNLKSLSRQLPPLMLLHRNCQQYLRMTAADIQILV